MHWSDINFHPTVKTLRQFAGLWIMCLSSLAAWQWFARSRTGAAAVLVALAATVGALGLARPTAIRWLFVGLTLATFPIGWLVSWLLFGGLYYGVFTPLALCFRLIGRDALSRRLDADAESYWTEKPPAPDVRRYFRQF
ncbi:MAG TPA: hypothetical protein VNH11_25445 [Pirellulales bacterium]|nr:hypothetical protein [Pirellulales bacterium]